MIRRGRLRGGVGEWGGEGVKPRVDKLPLHSNIVLCTSLYTFYHIPMSASVINKRTGNGLSRARARTLFVKRNFKQVNLRTHTTSSPFFDYIS